MTGLLFSLALLLALGFVAVRALGRRRRKRAFERALAERPGLSPECPIRVARFEDIDVAIDTLRCPCGGLLDRAGEGSRPGVRVVRCVCVVCEEEADLFFDLSELRH